ncbi:MAG: preprotein translocase subunit YajC [Muribaculaceae bacterium]|jgi:preprotein translocase subunit YajC|nr:preprotein translocase subunit YajC [Muribaculaceae bacterium]
MNLNSILLAAAAGGGDGGMMSLLMIVALIAIFYFFMIRPQSKKQKEIKKFREGLANGSKVITAGGIYGKIKEINDTTNTIILEIAENVKIKIDKGSVYPSAEDANQASANSGSKA